MMKCKQLKAYSIVVFGLILFIVSTLVFFLGKRLDKTPVIVDKTSFEYRDVYHYLIDFETLEFVSNQPNITTERALSGSYSGFVKGFNNYSPAALVPIPSNDSTEITGVNVSFWLSPSTSSISSALVFSVLDQNNNQILWDYAVIDAKSFSPGNWYTFEERFILPGKFVNSDFTVKVYLWNKDKDGAVVYIDDLAISFKESNHAVKPRTKLIDFEKSTDNKISSKYAKSGFYSSFAKGEDDFTSNVTIPLDELNVANLHSISYSFNYLSENTNLDAVFKVSLCDKDHNELIWNSVELVDAEYSPKKWETANGSLIIPQELLEKGEYLRLRLLNRNDNQVFVDDIYVVVKEKNFSSDSVLPAHNMMKNPVFETKANHPPYDFVNLNKLSVEAVSDFPMNNIFTKKPTLLIGKFETNQSQMQLLSVKSDAIFLIGFEKTQMKVKKVKFSHKLPQNASLFADNNYVFVFDNQSKNLMVYTYKKESSEFILQTQVTVSETKLIANVVSPANNIFSVLEANGRMSNYLLKEGTTKLISSSKLITPDNNNLKAFKSSFFDKNKTELLCIYLENNNCKYVFFEFNEASKSWELTSRHRNRTIQANTKLDFMSDYFVGDFDGNGLSDLLQLSRNPRFCMRIVSFDTMSYNIFYEVKFNGFKDNQNPKYYEITRMISADFTGDNKSELIIFQDNVNKVEWLTQKTEMYSFGN